jgi:hypothetical protein
VNIESRLAEVVTALEQVNIDSLVMGGHAVRFYGLNRNTNDFNLHIAPDSCHSEELRCQNIPFRSLGGAGCESAFAD